MYHLDSNNINRVKMEMQDSFSACRGAELAFLQEKRQLKCGWVWYNVYTLPSGAYYHVRHYAFLLSMLHTCRDGNEARMQADGAFSCSN